jgi:hypothetical protein
MLFWMPILLQARSGTTLDISETAQLIDSCDLDLTLVPEVPGNVYCPQTSVLLKASEGFDTYFWYANTSNSNTGGSLIVNTVDPSLEIDVDDWGFSYFYVEAFNDTCEAVSPVTFIDTYVFLAPVIESSGVNTYCEGDSTPISFPFQGAASYQWFRNGEPIPGATEQVYWVTETGTYTLTISYEICPDYFLSSGVGPSFNFLDLIVPEIVNDNGVFTLPFFEGTVVQWYQDGEPIPGATDTTLVPEFPGGEYTVEIIDINGCTGFTEPIFLYFTDAVGEVATPDVRLFPNPSNGFFFIESDQLINSIWVLDVLGRSILERHDLAQKEFRTDLSKIASGLYWVRLEFKSGAQLVMPIVIDDQG